MDNQGEPQPGVSGLTTEELPQMDGSCDACEPDEPQPATQVCHICSFAFCPLHADKHTSSTNHPLMPYYQSEAPAHGLGMGRGFANAADEERAVDEGMVAAVGGVNGASVGGAEGGREEAAAEPGKKDTVTVERLRCKVHGQEGSLYCKTDEQIVCVVCAVQGEHKEHDIITLYEAYVWQKSRQGYDLLAYTRQMGEKIQEKWTNPEMTTEELEDFVNGEFDELRRLVRLEERRTLHLVDLKEAFLTATAAEKMAEIHLQTERLQEEMDSINAQLHLLEQADKDSLGPALMRQAAMAEARPVLRLQNDAEVRPRLPEPRANPVDPRDLDDNDSGRSMEHAP
ncbi:tripartite motif-containing protein 44 [Boleophthalmus pectinirostris]|uniref:tripartite motif-containing protein 44 n=1 Tax=Boleophthalmus pectinirostris TaxID=150288 RepID=UPI000A1C62C8|nr:tripartite motif-containing protein 44 [Boleophthalmus pectinirostris]XP_055011626.1 tripartite motif-containing protein 44 [Boleophthalmus pectinirostris]XP_055011627.1 tripartite motif-containing protein 44 [Boleophthalmus pectinirostris]